MQAVCVKGMVNKHNVLSRLVIYMGSLEVCNNLC